MSSTSAAGPSDLGAATVNEKAGSRAKRARVKYTKRACEECRRRRSKCDGQNPSCSRCLFRGLDCTYPIEEDGRRPAQRSYVNLLRNRIEALERVLEFHSIDIDATMRDLSERQNGLPDSQDAVEVSEQDGSDLCETFEGRLCLDETVNFDRDGQARYFGPTSGRLDIRTFITDGIAQDQSDDNPPIESIVTGAQHKSRIYSALEEAGELEVPNELEQHLLDLYFTWEQPWCQVVDEKLFRESKATGGKYYSPLLWYSILAVASRYSDRLDVRSDSDVPNTAGKLFLEKAEVLLHFDLKWPSLTTIQSISILGTYYVAIGADAAGWLHQGMAARLAIDMGLNIDPSVLTKSRLISLEEADLRRQIYWALYCVDKLSSSYTGRVCMMLDSQGTVNLPACRMSGHQEQQSNIGFTSQDRLAILHCALITHCQLLEKIVLTLYSPKSTMSESQQSAFCKSLILELKAWRYDLPSELLMDRSDAVLSPQAFILHMVFHTSVILLLKPFIRKHNLDAMEKGVSESPGQKKSDHNAAMICYEAAKQICLTGKKYRLAHGTFRKSPLTATHCTLSAALFILQRQKTSSKMMSGADLTYLKSCLTVMGELSTSWHPALQYWKNLRRIHDKLCPPGVVELEASELSVTSVDHKLQPGLNDTSLPQTSAVDITNAMFDTQQLQQLTGMVYYDFEDWPNGGDMTNADGQDFIMSDEAFWQEFGLDFLSESLPVDYTGSYPMNMSLH